MQQNVRAAGVIPYMLKNGVAYFLLVKTNEKGYSDFGGKIENNETPQEIAAREASEESNGIFNREDVLQKIGTSYLYIPTSNSQKKLKEFRHSVNDDAITYMDVDLPELQGTPETVAREKARAASRIYGGPVLVEDVSLCFNAYKGLPGVYVKSFLLTIGPSGLHDMLLPYSDKSGYALCIYAYCDVTKSEEVTLFIGRTEGKIVPPRGPQVFGWDCIFEPLEGGGKTYAEMTTEEKSTISHRGKALIHVKAFLERLKQEAS